VVCVNVLSALSAAHQSDVLQGVLTALAPGGNAYFGLPRNLPPGGKLAGHNRRPQVPFVWPGCYTRVGNVRDEAPCAGAAAVISRTLTPLAFGCWADECAPAARCGRA
jgi:hypothetical protein